MVRAEMTPILRSETFVFLFMHPFLFWYLEGKKWLHFQNRIHLNQTAFNWGRWNPHLIWDFWRFLKRAFIHVVVTTHTKTNYTRIVL
jgi:hypothetical protein